MLQYIGSQRVGYDLVTEQHHHSNEDQNFKMGVIDLKAKRWQDCIPSEGSQEILLLLFWSFPALRGHQHSLAVASFHLQGQKFWAQSFSHCHFSGPLFRFPLLFLWTLVITLDPPR